MAGYEDEVICDLAEVYRIYDIYEHPPFFIATLIIGLRNNSRTKMKMAGLEYTTDQLMYGSILDKLTWLCWTKTKDGLKGRNKPDSVLDKMLGKEEKRENEIMSFKDSQSFDAAWQRINEV